MVLRKKAVIKDCPYPVLPLCADCVNASSGQGVPGTHPGRGSGRTVSCWSYSSDQTLTELS